jgi:hypothetical protein
MRDSLAPPPVRLLPAMSGVAPRPALGYVGQMTDEAVTRVQAFIARLAPKAVCDDCIAHRLELADLDAGYASRELAGSAGFERRKGECSLCGATKEVTRLKS